MGGEDSDIASRGAERVQEEAETLSAALSDREENRAKRWMLLTGDRLNVVAVLLLVIAAVLVGVSFVRPLDVRGLLSETNTVKTLFSALLSGAILLVSIVVSINSTVLSQELGDVQSQQESVASSIEYHQHIEEFIEPEITPAEPREFLRVILHTLAKRVQTLDAAANEGGSEQLRTRLDTFRTEVIDEVIQARDTLNTHFGTVTVLLVGLNYDYTSQLQAARRLKQDDALNDDEEERIDDIIETLKVFATGREYFKSLYYKRELAQLSSRLLLVSLPVIIFTSYILLVLDTEFLPEGALFGVPLLLLFISFAYAVALAPYVVLTAYVTRIVTVTVRTLASGPFILREGNEPEELDWGSPEESLDWESLRRQTDD